MCEFSEDEMVLIEMFDVEDCEPGDDLVVSDDA